MNGLHVTEQAATEHPGRDWGPVVVWAVWAIATALPFVSMAWGANGRFFPGAFLFVDDVYQNLSFVEQARHGALLFTNKFDTRPFEPSLLHLEWLGVGWIAAALGGRVLLAFHVAGALAGALFAAATTSVLRAAGLRKGALAIGLAIVLCGSGAGWFRALQGATLSGVPDAFYAIYPFNLRMLGGPHGLLGTGLLIAGLHALVRWRQGERGPGRFLIITTVLGLSRPFDMALLGGTAAVLAGLDLARGTTFVALLRKYAALLWLLPVLAYDFFIFRIHPSFALYSSAQNSGGRVPWSDLAVALGPAALVALAHFFRRPSSSFVPLRQALVAATAVTSLALVLPVSFGTQFLNSLGAILLILVVTVLPGRALAVAFLALCPTSFWLLANLSSSNPRSLPAREVAQVLRSLDEQCRPGELVLAPVSLSLFAAGVTPCRVVGGHWVLTPDYQAQVSAMKAFYAPGTDPAVRARLLERWQPDLLIAPRTGWPLESHWSLQEAVGDIGIWRRRPSSP